MDNYFYIFLIIGLIHGLILDRFRTDIFDYNPELDFFTLAINVNKKGEKTYFLRDKRVAYAKAPCAWKIEKFLSTVLGVILGWVLLWFLIDKRLEFFSKTKIKWEDIGLFLLSYIGINGRLPTIAHAVQEWFRR